MYEIVEIGPSPVARTFPMGITLGAEPHSTVDKKCNWGSEPIPLEDACTGFVYASHVLEHVPWYLTGNALAEAYRILRPGGRIELWVPDFNLLVQTYLGKIPPGGNWWFHNPSQKPILWVAGRLFAGMYGPEPAGWHKALFDEEHLRQCLQEAGFCKLHRLESPPKEQVVNHVAINLGMEGFKP